MLPILLALFVSVTGCRFAKNMSPADPATYHVIEGRDRLEVRQVTIRYSDPLRDVGFDSYSTYLLTAAPQPGDSAALNRIIRHTPKHRILEGQGSRDPAILSLADWISKDQPKDHHRWIIANRPLVVAVEADPAPKPKGWGATPVRRLVQEQNMGRRIGKILVLEEWPKEVRREASPPKTRRVIKLDPPQTLREVYAAPPWLPPVARGGVGEPDGAASAVRSAK